MGVVQPLIKSENCEVSSLSFRISSIFCNNRASLDYLSWDKSVILYENMSDKSNKKKVNFFWAYKFLQTSLWYMCVMHSNIFIDLCS